MASTTCKHCGETIASWGHMCGYYASLSNLPAPAAPEAPPKLESRADLHPTETQRKKEGLAAVTSAPAAEGEPLSELIVNYGLAVMYDERRRQRREKNDDSYHKMEAAAKAITSHVAALEQRLRERDAQLVELERVVQDGSVSRGAYESVCAERDTARQRLADAERERDAWKEIPVLTGCCVACGDHLDITAGPVNDVTCVRVRPNCACNAGVHLWQSTLATRPASRE